MQYNFSNFKNDLKKVEEYLSKEYTQLNTGRASPMVLDGINVEVYGAYQPIKNVASVNIEDVKTLRVAPWDKSQIKDVDEVAKGDDDDGQIQEDGPVFATKNHEDSFRHLRLKT